MSKNTQTLKQTLQLIIDILSFESSNEDLKNQLVNTDIDWDQIVIVASEHLVLPTVYCRLEQKSLLNFLPEDLVLYLTKLTQLNRERNQTLLSEAEEISTIFKTNSIQHVFIKGAALLIGEYYKDLGERMIGDIDILVASTDLDKAFDLLVSEGYDEFVSFNYEVKNYRHRPRQISDGHLGAIELHDQLLKHDYNHLIDKALFLSSKDMARGIALPNSDMLIWNTILAHQINDRCYYYNTIKLKSIYDLIVSGLSQNQVLLKELSNQKYSLGFLTLASVFCPQIAPSKHTVLNRFKKQTFLLSINIPVLGGQVTQLKSLYIGLKERIKLLFLNKSYRAHVVKNKLNK